MLEIHLQIKISFKVKSLLHSEAGHTQGTSGSTHLHIMSNYTSSHRLLFNDWTPHCIIVIFRQKTNKHIIIEWILNLAYNSYNYSFLPKILRQSQHFSKHQSFCSLYSGRIIFHKLVKQTTCRNSKLVSKYFLSLKLCWHLSYDNLLLTCNLFYICM